MAKVYQETDNMDKEELVNMILEKDKQILALESIKNKLMEIYEEHKVSDTFRIHTDKINNFVSKMEWLLCDIKNKGGGDSSQH